MVISHIQVCSHDGCMTKVPTGKVLVGHALYLGLMHSDPTARKRTSRKLLNHDER